MGSLPVELAKREGRKPTWEMALIFPDQGYWSEDDYLELDSNRLIEFTDGRVEFLPMPTKSHQWIVRFLEHALLSFVQSRRLGWVVHAPFPIRIEGKKFREPDVAFLSAKNSKKDGETHWEGADLVMEVVSAGNPARDRIRKRREYAKAGIPEYWIVDPLLEKVTVLYLKKGRYAVHGEFKKGQRATSRLLSGFEVDVTGVLDAC